MKKVFVLFALAFALLSCNKVVTDIQPVEPSAPESEVITITAKLGPKTSPTRAVADNGDGKITVIWAVDEHLAILYEAGGEKKMADARITEVDAVTGAATIEFVVEGAENDTPCTIVYPLTAAKDDYSGVQEAATLLASQNGTLNASLDVRVGEGTIQTTDPGLTVTSQPAPQFAIFKFTTLNADGTSALQFYSLDISMGGQEYTIHGGLLPSELYVALPAVREESVAFTGWGYGKKFTASFPSVSFEAGFYYQSSIRLAPVVVDLSTLTGNYQVQHGETLTGTLEACYAINVAPLATVTLSGVDIDMSRFGTDAAGIWCIGDAFLVLEEGTSNRVVGYGRSPGIYIAPGYRLTIEGTGELHAIGGGWGAGIGGGDEIDCGEIWITGGTIHAEGSVMNYQMYGDHTNGYAYGAAGIGGGYHAACDDIYIFDTVTRVTAQSYGNCPSIGPGEGGTWSGIIFVGLNEDTDEYEYYGPQPLDWEILWETLGNCVIYEP